MSQSKEVESLFTSACNERHSRNYKKAYENLQKVKALDTSNNKSIHYFGLWDEMGSIAYWVNDKESGREAFAKLVKYGEEAMNETLVKLKEQGDRVLQNARFYDCPELCKRLENVIEYSKSQRTSIDEYAAGIRASKFFMKKAKNMVIKILYKNSPTGKNLYLDQLVNLLMEVGLYSFVQTTQAQDVLPDDLCFVFSDALNNCQSKCYITIQDMDLNKLESDPTYKPEVNKLAFYVSLKKSFMIWDFSLTNIFTLRRKGVKNVIPMPMLYENKPAESALSNMMDFYRWNVNEEHNTSVKLKITSNEHDSKYYATNQ